MKFRFLALLALVLGLASCQKDTYGLEVDSKGEAAVTLNVALPDDATRAAGTDSAKGGVNNVDLTNAYDIRFILEVYNLDGSLAKERMTEVKDTETSASFSFRLVPGRNYKFVVWADFVNQGSDGKDDLHYDTSAGLDEVKVKMANWTVIDESRDAYTGFKVVENFSSLSALTEPITLTRPFAKLRVVTNDIKEMISVRPAVVKVNYFNTKFYNTFDAFSAEAKNLVDAPANLTAILADDTYTGEEPEETGVQTLFADYFFGAENDRVMFYFDVQDNGGVDLPQVTFNTNIPVQRNYLTTIYGPILTDANNITVTINDAFENGPDWNPEEDEFDIAVWDGQGTNEPAYDPATKTYTIKNGDELAWLADQVNGVTRAASNAFSGYNFVLAKDINLGDNEWTPIGGPGKYFAGTFDGKNYTVSNFQVTKQEGHAALFGNARATIKNLNVENVKIVSHHYAGAIVGQGYSKIDGCHVDNIDITLTTKDGDFGDKAGGIIGQNCEGAGMYVKNSTAKNVTIKGYRDLGGIAGMAHNSNTVSDCSVENITILQDLSVNYEDNTPTTLGAVIGRKGTNVIDENNTVGEGIEIAVLAANLEQLQAALDAAKAGQTNIHIVADIEGDITVTQKDGVHITIDGKENKYNGTITVNGQSSTVNDKSLTIKNVKFETEESNLVFIASTTDAVRYARNITIEDCTFKGSGDTSEVVALNLRQAYDIEVNNCKATDLHSFGQITSSDNMSFTKLIVTSGRGLNFQTAAHGTVVFNECNITATKYDGYGIRVARYAGNSLTVNNSTISAFEPVVLRGTATPFTLNLNKSTLTATGNGAENIVFTEPADIFIDGYKYVSDGVLEDENGNLVVNSLETLETALTSAGAAGAGDTTIVFAEDTTLDMTNAEWTPIKVDGYHGADIVTIEGNGAVITGLKAPLFAGGFAGGSGIVIKNLTIKDSNIVSANTLGSGAFIESVDSMDKIELTNCHLLDSTVTGGDGSRTGGLLGWTAGFNDVNNGPVKTYVTIDNCSVIGCTIQCNGSVGGINGHAGNNAWTYTTIQNCTIQNNNLISTNTSDWRTGVVVGTANVGEVIIKNITESGNTLTQTGKTAPEGYKRNYYGRAVLGSTGMLIINDNAIVASQETLQKAVKEYSATKVTLTTGNYELSGLNFVANNVTLKGDDKANVVLNLENSIYLQDKSVTLENLTYNLNAGKGYTEQAFAFVHHATAFNLKNCNVNRLRLNVNEANIEGCTFTLDTSSGFDGYCIYYYGNNGSTVNVKDSTFATAGKGICIYSESAKAYNLNVDKCTFTSSDSATDKAAIQMHTELGISGNVRITETTATGFADINGGLWNELNNNTKVATDKFDIWVDGTQVH